MASIVVRGIDESVKQSLAKRAKAHGRSMEAEVREILTRATSGSHIGLAFLDAARDAGGVEELVIPEHVDEARKVDFG
ncbi:Arc family DNA-binding protein [Glutamicibacter sp. MNS18]|uniref:FitA-like ribbon-helix-helix domain-containing protein n=1 Tax=Glutamicibacter sp. MNS18 TaxID=2989817 RepID=UPI002235C9E1|nr:Arc family DNA-binding protein [Glutamicibacter sp. MNS18]MCW4464260.1 Arc family DNA-binding protein [Glutamicibacter sp. MNS18]